jgi:hydrogenase nickel incorporation protein HypA/HybF
MHEFSITSSIIDILKNIIKDRDIKKILKVNFLTNSYGGIEPESIKFYYEFLTKDDPDLKDARLIFKKEKIKINCNNCGESFEVFKLFSNCRKCSSSNLSIIFPEDIKIKSIEI